MFCPNANRHKPKDYTFLASSQLITSIPWPCYCNAHVYAVNFMWYCVCIFCSEVTFLMVCLYMYCRSRYSYQEGMVGIKIISLTPPHMCTCPKPGLAFQSSCRFLVLS